MGSTVRLPWHLGQFHLFESVFMVVDYISFVVSLSQLLQNDCAPESFDATLSSSDVSKSDFSRNPMFLFCRRYFPLHDHSEHSQFE